MGIVKNILYKLTPEGSISRIQDVYKPEFIVPYYHVVSDHKLPHLRHLFPYKNVKRFIEDLDYLLKYFVPLTLDDLYDYNANSNQKGFILTFDDGLREMYEIVAPILKERKIPAIFFVNNSFVDNMGLFYRFKVSLVIERIVSNSISLQHRKDVANCLTMHNIHVKNQDIVRALKLITYLNKSVIDEVAQILNVDFHEFLRNEKPYLTSSQIKELINAGFYIGGHSIDHPRYKLISLKDQVHQTEASVQFVQKQFNLNYKLFAFPHSDQGVSKEFFSSVMGLDGSTDLIFANSGLREDIDHRIIQRFSLDNPQLDIAKQVPSEFLYSTFNKLVGNYNIKRKDNA